MADYLDNLPEYTAKATLVIANLGFESFELWDAGEDDLSILQTIAAYDQWLQGANDTSQDRELRLVLLTLLVDQARLNNMVTTPGIASLYQTVGPTEIATVPFALITGSPEDNPALVAYILSQISFLADIPAVLSGTKSWGKYVNGDVVPAENETIQDVIIEALTEYLNPAFSSFAISGQSQQVEAYTIIAAGSKTFTFGITNSANATANSIVIVYVNGYGSGPVTLGTGLSTTSPHALALPTQIQIASGSRTFSITGTKAAPGSGTFTTSFVILYAFKNFYGTGVIPATSADVRSRSNTFEQTFSITIAAGQTQVFFAYPSTHPNISNGSVIYVEGFNSSVGSTFGSPATVAVTQGDGVTTANYKVYSLTLPVAYGATATYIVTVPAIP